MMFTSLLFPLASVPVPCLLFRLFSDDPRRRRSERIDHPFFRLCDRRARGSCLSARRVARRPYGVPQERRPHGRREAKRRHARRVRDARVGGGTRAKRHAKPRMMLRRSEERVKDARGTFRRTSPRGRRAASTRCTAYWQRHSFSVQPIKCATLVAWTHLEGGTGRSRTWEREQEHVASSPHHADHHDLPGSNHIGKPDPATRQAHRT